MQAIADLFYFTPALGKHHQFGLGLVLGIGVEAKIISKLYFKADWRFEVIMQYPAIGLSYQF